MIRRGYERASIALAAALAAVSLPQPTMAGSPVSLAPPSRHAKVLAFDVAQAIAEASTETAVGKSLRRSFIDFAAAEPPLSDHQSFALLISRPTRAAITVASSDPVRCRSAGYFPSALLAEFAENRRRILFPYVEVAACRAGLPVGLLDALLIQESGYNPAARSPKGAFGLGQLMPATAHQLGVDAYDIRQNLEGAARYFAQQLQEFGSPHLALAAYNAGPERVRRSQGVPNITETRAYVSAILKNWALLASKRRYFP